jgi:hypothetical protein
VLLHPVSIEEGLGTGMSHTGGPWCDFRACTLIGQWIVANANGPEREQGHPGVLQCQQVNELNGFDSDFERALRNTMQQFQEYLVAEK